MGHLGLTPQSVHKMGGYVVQGRDEDAARKILEDALALERAGCFALVLEGVPLELARQITAAAVHPHHRHRRGQVLRRPGARLLRPAGDEPGLQAQVRQALRQPPRLHDGGGGRLLLRGARGHLPGRGALLQVQAHPPGGLQRRSPRTCPPRAPRRWAPSTEFRSSPWPRSSFAPSPRPPPGRRPSAARAAGWRWCPPWATCTRATSR